MKKLMTLMACAGLICATTGYAAPDGPCPDSPNPCHGDAKKPCKPCHGPKKCHGKPDKDCPKKGDEASPDNKGGVPVDPESAPKE